MPWRQVGDRDVGLSPTAAAGARSPAAGRRLQPAQDSSESESGESDWHSGCHESAAGWPRPQAAAAAASPRDGASDNFTLVTVTVSLGRMLHSVRVSLQPYPSPEL